MSLEEFATLYLSYVNEFLTVEGFASHYGLTIEKAEFIVMTGRAIAYFGE
jgi:hypothetical protein